jgi:hypothetical protein
MTMPLRVPYRGERSVEIKSRDEMASSFFSAAAAPVGCVMEEARSALNKHADVVA